MPKAGCWMSKLSSHLWALAFFLSTLAAGAHTPSETFLTVFVSSGSITGQWDVAERDLVQGSGLDPEKAAALRPDELDLRLEALALDVVARLEIKADGRRLELRPTDYLVIRMRELNYIRVPFDCGTNAALEPAAVEINASALFRVDTNIHGLLRVDHRDQSQAASFNAAEPVRRFTLGPDVDRWAQWQTFIREGVTHIWQGFDHLLFLLALLLPSVLRREGGRWVVTDNFRHAMAYIVKIVTAFTLAHSLTLSLAVLDVVRISPRVVEPIIAASVIAAAVNNIWPWFGERGWLVALAFGLIHGFGFAGALEALGLMRQSLAVALVGFNVGVELGQLAIVLAFLPLAFGNRHSWVYRVLVVRLGSGMVAILAGIWMCERALGYADFSVMRALLR